MHRAAYFILCVIDDFDKYSAYISIINLRRAERIAIIDASSVIHKEGGSI